MTKATESDLAIIGAYMEFSEFYYAAGFMSPNETMLDMFEDYLVRFHFNRELCAYERDALPALRERYEKARRKAGVGANGLDGGETP